MWLDGDLHIWSGDEEAFPYFRERGGSPNFNIPPVGARPFQIDGLTDDLMADVLLLGRGRQGCVAPRRSCCGARPTCRSVVP